MVKPMRQPLLLIVVVGLAISGLAQSQTGTGRYDQQIQQEATRALQSKDKWKEMTASTDDAIVTLQGRAKVLIDKLDAQKKVSNLDHVQGVRNHVQVEGRVPDQQLQQQLADKLRYDRVGYGIVFNALAVGVQGGVATISGQVHDYPSRDSALAIAETTPGVKEVITILMCCPRRPWT